jgi:hypothetical protein
MKRIIILSVSLFLAFGCLYSDVHAQKKLAQTGCQFLSVGTDARATAMGEAYTTVEGSSASLFYNPAGMARMNKTVEFTATQMKWIADINYVAGSMGFRPFHGRFGVIGVSFMSIDYGDLQGTRVADNDQGFEETGNFAPSAYTIGVGYANDLTDRFAVGGQVKYVHQDLGSSTIPLNNEAPYVTEEKDYAQSVFAFDFGTVYKTGFKSMVFGMSVRNFSREVKYEREGFQLPLTFKVGFSMNAMDFFPGLQKNHALLVSVDAAHPRDFPEYINVGGEYIFMKMLALRAGYVTAQDDYGFTAGFGVHTFGVAIDYSYMPFDVFDNVNRFTVRFNL